MDAICWASHSFLKLDRVAEVFTESDPLLISRGGITYRVLLRTKRGKELKVKVAECMRTYACTTLVMVIWDNLYSRLAGGAIWRSQDYDQIIAVPRVASL